MKNVCRKEYDFARVVSFSSGELVFSSGYWLLNQVPSARIQVSVPKFVWIAQELEFYDGVIYHLK